MALDPVPRTVIRMATMVEGELRRGEKLDAALPTWIGGTYVPFLASIVAGAGLAAAMAPGLGANSLIVTALGAAFGAIIGRWLAMRAAAGYPIDSRALQVFVGATNMRVLVYEPKSWGKPGRLLATIPLRDIGNVSFEKGGFVKPSRLEFLTPDGPHQYEFSGLWDVRRFLAALEG